MFGSGPAGPFAFDLSTRKGVRLRYQTHLKGKAVRLEICIDVLIIPSVAQQDGNRAAIMALPAVSVRLPD